jgi:hypothetical protein
MRHHRLSCAFLLTLALSGPGAPGQPSSDNPDEQLDKRLPAGALARVPAGPVAREGAVQRLAFGPDDRLLTGRQGGAVDWWDATTGRHVRRLWEHPLGVHGLAFSADGKQVVTWSSNQAPRFRDLTTGKEVRRIPESADFDPGVQSVSADGKVVASWRATAGGGTIELRNTETGKRLRTLNSGAADRLGNAVPTLAFSADGRWLACLNPQAAPVLLWDLTGEGEPVGVEPGVKGAAFVAFAPDGKTMAVAGLGGALAFGPPGHQPRQRTPDRPGDQVTAVTFSPDGRLLATGHLNGAVCLWEAVSGGQRRSFAGHQDAVYGLAFSPDGKRLASGGADPAVYVWAVREPEAARPGGLGDENLQRLRTDLLNPDAARAERAMRTLAANPDRGLPFLRGRLGIGEKGDAEVRRLVGQLDDDEFTVREKATRELTQRGEQAEPALRRTLADRPPIELRRRVADLLARLDAAEPSPTRVRAVRAVETLEWVGTPGALRLLRETADGSPLPWAASEAEAALRRREGQEKKP